MHGEKSEIPFQAGAFVAAYLRASPGRNQDLSVNRQEAVIRQWCAENGLILRRIFSDDNRSGGTTMGRAQFDAMIRYFENGADEAGIVFWEYSRLARDYDDSQYYLSKLRRNGYTLYSLSDNVPSGSVGKVVESLYLWAAEDERKRLGERIKSGQRYMVSVHHCYSGAGRHGSPPLGYQFEEVIVGKRRDGTPHKGKRLVPDPVTAPLVKKAYMMRLAGRSLREICDDTGLSIHTQTISRMLDKSLYIGIFEFGGMRIEGFCEPLIDVDTWKAVKRIRKEDIYRRNQYHPRRITSTYLLSGLLRCGLCGANVYGVTSNYPAIGKIYHYYGCVKQKYRECENQRIRSDRFEKIILDKIVELLDKPQVIQDLALELQMAQADGDVERQAALEFKRQELKETQREMGNILAAIREGGEGVRGLVLEMKRLEEKEIELQDKLNELEMAGPMPVLVPDLDVLSFELKQAIENADRRKLQLLLRSIIRVIDMVFVNKKLSGAIYYVLGGEGVLSL